MHLGNARTALLAWLQAREAGGRFVLRIEDLDPTRAREAVIPTTVEDLEWLG
ncbi:MAG TPA: glutamate--tRNA ligase family protein, partial [Deinococcales bacterium]|nr:glutamate--tRNA ligase family protein [Deinococcales bacterium]